MPRLAGDGTTTGKGLQTIQLAMQTAAVFDIPATHAPSCVFVLALRAILHVPGLMAMIALGFGIEYMQAFTGRHIHVWDGVANTIGVLLGATMGLSARRL